MRKTVHRVARTVGILAGAALALAACGGSDDGAGNGNGNGNGNANGSDTDADGLYDVAIGVIPIMPTAVLQVALDEGIFEDHGVELELSMSQGGAAIIPAVVSGEVDFGTSNVISLLQARQQGIDVRVIAHWSSGQTDEDDPIGLYAMPDSGIESAADLEGRTVAVNTLNNLGELTVRGAIRAAGGDDNLVEFVEMGFPDMPAALDSGQIDVAYVPEPFMTMIEENGGVLFSYPHWETHPGLPTQMVFTSGAYLEENPEIVEAMTAAVNEAQDVVAADPDVLRDAAVELLGMDPDIAATARLEAFGSDLRREEVQIIADLIVEYGMIDGTPDVEGLMPAE